MAFRSLIYPGTALYFGTFNPIHIGHLMIAQAVLNQSEINVNGITFIPAGNPPHRHADTDLLDARRRFAMVRLATAAHPRFQVSGIELQAAAGSSAKRVYTVDTLRRLIAAHGMTPPVPLIIGSDALAGLPGWREPETLVDLAWFLQAPRPGYPPVESLHIAGRHIPLRTRLIEMPPLAVSAAWVRQTLQSSVASPDALRYMLPEPVRQYIQENRLYTD